MQLGKEMTVIAMGFYLIRGELQLLQVSVNLLCQLYYKSVQSALSDLLTTSATHGTFSRPSMKRGLISIIKLMQFTIVRFF